MRTCDENVSNTSHVVEGVIVTDIPLTPANTVELVLVEAVAVLTADTITAQPPAAAAARRQKYGVRFSINSSGAKPLMLQLL